MRTCQEKEGTLQEKLELSALTRTIHIHCEAPNEKLREIPEQRDGSGCRPSGKHLMKTERHAGGLSGYREE